MENETKSRILHEALKLFSQKGYKAVSVHQIAAAVGIKAPSLYNHFGSKKEIFDAIVEMMSERFGRVSYDAKLPVGNASEQLNQYAHGGIDLLKSTARHLFHYYLTDEYASCFGKMLSIEKHGNPQADSIHGKIYIDEPLSFQTELFTQMIHRGYMIEVEPQIAAIQFFAPIFLLLDKYASRPEKESEALKLLDRHIEQFCRVYTKTQLALTQEKEDI